MQHIILGSQSPRRKELLEKAGIKFDVILPNVAEIIPPEVDAFDAAAYLSGIKNDDVTTQISGNNTIVITADTIVINDGNIFGKPHSLTEAKSMLQALSGHTHYVVTGICIADKNKKIFHTSKVAVAFKELSIEEITYYINNFQVLDKAGAYAIQEWIGLIGIEKIDGDYYTVMGLPINWLYTTLKNEFNYSVLE